MGRPRESTGTFRPTGRAPRTDLPTLAWVGSSDGRVSEKPRGARWVAPSPCPGDRARRTVSRCRPRVSTGCRCRRRPTRPTTPRRRPPSRSWPAGWLALRRLRGLHLLMLDGTPRLVMAPWPRAAPSPRAPSRSSCARKPLPDHLAQPATAGLVLVAVGNAVLHLVLVERAAADDQRHADRRRGGRRAALAALAGRHALPRLGGLGRRRLRGRPGGRSGRTTSSAWCSATAALARRQPSPAGGRPRPGARSRRGRGGRRARPPDRRRQPARAGHGRRADGRAGPPSGRRGALHLRRHRRAQDGQRRPRARRRRRGHRGGRGGAAAATRATDVVARWGGDEFCVVGPGPGMAPLELERRVRDSVVLQAPRSRPRCGRCGSAPAARCSRRGTPGTLETLLGKADQEMYLRRSLRRGGVRAAAAAPAGRLAAAEPTPAPEPRASRAPVRYGGRVRMTGLLLTGPR